MNLSWLFSDEAPLPRGYRLAVFHHEAGELGKRRLDEAAGVLGVDAAHEAARKLGRYEIDEESVRRIGLAGAKTDEGGEIPALSPVRWTELSEAEGWGPPEEGAEIAGLLLTRSQRESFLQFLTRNHGSEGADLAPDKVVRLARHFFFQEPVVVVLRYTPPRFARS